MPTKQKIRLAVVLAALTGVYLLLFRHTPGGVFIAISPAILAIALFAILYSPRARDFIRAYPRLVLAGGWLLIALAGLLFVVEVSAAKEQHQVEMDSMVGSLALLFIGIMMLQLPRMIKRYDEQVARTRSLTPSTGRKISGIAEAFSAVASLWTYRGVFARTALPWSVIVILLPMAVYQFLAYRHGLIASPFDKVPDKSGESLAILALLLPISILELLAVPTIMLAWNKWLLLGRKPAGPVALPGRYFLRYLFVAFVVSVMLNTMTKLMLGNTNDIANLIGTHDVAGTAQILAGAATMLLLLGASVYGPMLSAIATGQRQYTLIESARAARSMSHWYIGVIFTTAPFLALRWAVLDAGRWIANPALAVSILIAWVSQLLLFAAFLAAATYFTRAYQASRPVTANAPET